MTSIRQRSSQSWADIDDEERAKENLENCKVVEEKVDVEVAENQATNEIVEEKVDVEDKEKSLLTIID